MQDGHSTTWSINVWCARFALGMLTLVIVPGCSRVPEGNARVTGKIKMHTGEPLTGVHGIVRFDPEELYTGGDRGASTGWLNGNGCFEIMTQKAGDGVPLGDYRVVLVVRGVDDTPADQVHFDYKHFETTPWRAKVTAEGPNYFELTLDAVDERPLIDHDLPDHDY